MYPRLPVHWEKVNLCATEQVDYGFLCLGGRGEKCTFSGDIFVDAKCESGTL